MIEDIFIFPFILAGRLIAVLRPLGKEYRVFFFFPFYHTGGAELFNMRLAHAVGGPDCIIFFTKRSINNRFYKEFERSDCVIKDISRFTDNKWLYFFNLIQRGIITGYINRQKTRPIVFNGQCNFGYKISPWINKNVIQLEFIHTLCSFSYIRIPFISFYRYTISGSEKTINDHKILYAQKRIPPAYADRFLYILYGIELPSLKERSFSSSVFPVLFAGRGSPEKRVHIVGKIAAKANQIDASVEFRFMGDVQSSIPGPLHKYCVFLGNQSDPETIDEIYNNSSILIITSSFEGFPLVVMEAMARGLAIISTPVGDVPKHVKNGVNGFIIDELSDESNIIDEGLNYILKLKNDRELLQTISAANTTYARTYFGIETFNSSYRKLFNELQSK